MRALGGRLQKARASDASTAGMTLIEVIVSVAIIAIVSLSVFSAFQAFLNSQQQAYQHKTEAENVEAAIASGADPDGSINTALDLDGFVLPSTADTFTGGGSSYTIIEGSNTVVVPTLYFGDGAGAFDNGYETGTSGGMMAYTVPASGRYQLEVWGAAGGQAAVTNMATQNSRGGYAAGTISLNRGELLYLYAGGAGENVVSETFDRHRVYRGGANGGGDGIGDASSQRTGGGGGTDIRVNQDSLYTRVVVAGGGGGNSNHSPSTCRGGNGGGGSGGFGTYSPPSPAGYGGTQNAGGNGMSGYASGANNGSFGLGGTTRSTPNTIAGGGGGWYGGGVGNGAGGGSGWAFTQATYNSWTNGADKPLYLLDDFGAQYYLTDAVLIDGSTNMPDPLSSGTIAGKTGGGFIRITYLGA